MKRRVMRAVFGSSAFALVVFLIPLAVVAVVFYVAQTRIGLEHDALSSLITIGRTLGSGDQVELPSTVDTSLAVYGADGKLVAGSGPSMWDPVTAAAARGRQSEGTDGAQLVVGVPVPGDEKIIGVVRAARPWSSVIWGAALICVALVALAALVLLASSLVARRTAGVLSAPIEKLAETAVALGDGELMEAKPSGIDEADRVQAALRASGKRLHDALERERRVAANASHQLRTPLAAMRADLETSLTRADGSVTAAANAAIVTIDELDATIDDVLALTRGAARDVPTAPVNEIAQAALDRWAPRFASRDRSLHLAHDHDASPVPVPRAMTTQVLDILLDNALRHGGGATSVIVRDAGDATAIDVTDQGTVQIEGDLFADGVSSGNRSGLGLGIAAKSARDHDAILILASRTPATRFTLLIRR